ncbi:hypothetical protein ACQP3L_39400, partial [Escherichia coli]
GLQTHNIGHTRQQRDPTEGRRGKGRKRHYWGNAEAQDASILDLHAVLEETAERSEVREGSGKWSAASSIWG